MPDPNPNPAPSPSATPDWKQSFGAEAASVLETFKEPGEFLKSYSDLSGEVKSLKDKQPTFDWRKEIAGEDESIVPMLERYATGKDFGKAHKEAVTKIRSGEMLKPLPENATPEQVSAYRKERGIPEKPEGYLEKLPDGLVIGEADKHIFDSFVKGLHDLNADPKLAHYAVKWYSDFQESAQAERAEADTEQRSEVEDALRGEWAADYRANVNHVKAFLESAPDGIGDLIANARDAEGRALLNNAAVLKWLAGTAREMNPISTIVPGTSGNDLDTVQGEKTKIEKFMRENRTEYNRDSKMQQRYRDLIDAELKLKKRAA